MLALLLFACSTPDAPAAAPQAPAAQDHADHATAPGGGEVAAWVAEGDVVKVNNKLCAVSHSPLDPSKLDAFTSTVTYTGEDPRFVGRKLVFNQCCSMCIEKFPTLWSQDAEGILRFHGLM